VKKLTLFACIFAFACTKVPGHYFSAAPLAQKQYLASLTGTPYSAFFQYDDSLQTSYLEFNQTGYIASYFVYYSGRQAQLIASATDSLGSDKDSAYRFVYDPSTERIFKILHLTDGSYDSLGFDGLGRLGSIYRYSGSPLVFTEYDTVTFNPNNDLADEYEAPVTNNYRFTHFTYDTVANPLQATNLGYILAILNGGAWEDLSANNVTSRVISTFSAAAPTPVVIETDTDVYTYGSNGLPARVTETQVNAVTGTLAYTFTYAYVLK
jgi:hypothetical protein